MGSWVEKELRGHICDVFEPSTPSVHGYVVVYLHGVHLGRLVDKPKFTQQFAQHGLRVVAPMTGPTWWTDRVCTEFDAEISAERYVLEHVLPFTQAQFGAAPPRIALLGTSMGGQGALRMAFKYPDVFPVVAALSPAIDYQLRWDEGDEVLPTMYADAEAIRQDTATLHIHPLNWPRNIWFACDPTDTRWHESVERLQMKLTALGIPHDCDLATVAGGHGSVYYNHMAPAAVAFITERLDAERLSAT